MPSSAQLKAHAKELAQKIHDVEHDEKMSQAERTEAFAKLNADFKAHQEQVRNHELASSMKKDLGPEDVVGKSVETTDEDLIAQLREVPNLGQARKAFARNLITHPVYKQVVQKLGGEKGFNGTRTTFDERFDVDLKTFGTGSTEAYNVMGEGVAGSNAVAAAGQNPFLSGAWGPGILPTFLPGIVEKLFYQLRIADLIPSVPVTTPDITYLTESTANWESNQVAETGTYPFSSNAFSRVYAQVGKIANAMVVSDEAIRDAPQLFSFVQGRLIEGVQRQEEVQLLAGSGYPGVGGLLSFSSNFIQTGSATTSSNVVWPGSAVTGIGAQPQTISSLTYGRVITNSGTGSGLTSAGVQMATGIFDAIVDVQLSVYQMPNAIVMNPLDWQTIRLSVDGNAQFYGGGFFGTNYGYPNPAAGNESYGVGERLWNLPVVNTPAIPQGTCLLGWFDQGTLQAARREGVSMQMTNSNGTDFVQGQVTIRAEERLGLMVYRPAAFELIQFSAG